MFELNKKGSYIILNQQFNLASNRRALKPSTLCFVQFQPLDFEEGAETELSISVENEVPYFSCKVQERTSSGLWKVDTGHGVGSGQPHSVQVLIHVEDTNDPPVFTVSGKEPMLEENTPTGTWVERVSATDPDTTYARDFV